MESRIERAEGQVRALRMQTKLDSYLGGVGQFPRSDMVTGLLRR